MAVPIQCITLPLAHDEIDEVIDVRSPEEYAVDHITGAINLPVLDDAERAMVGTMYKQQSPFEARKIGAALVSAAISEHLKTHFTDKPKAYRPLLYCWRGGQRSNSLATVLSEVGWQVSVLRGGYKSYRRHVRETIDSLAPTFTYRILNGLTGSGKTRVLRAMHALGGQVLDLEGLANHKGSLFGGHLTSPQPAQKRFESLVFDQLQAFSTDRPVWVEAESPKIGFMNIPTGLLKCLRAAEVTEIVTPTASRADYLYQDYQDWIELPERIDATIERLSNFHSKARIAEWKAMCDRGAWRELITALLVQHYDTRYGAEGSGHYQTPVAQHPLADQSPKNIEACAKHLLAIDQTTKPE